MRFVIATGRPVGGMIRCMSAIDVLAADFLAQQRIAVTGVSARRQTTGNLIARALRKRGKTVYAIAPGGGEVDGHPSFRSLAELPEVPDGVLVVTRASLAEEVVRQCIAAGVVRIWMHDMFGTRPRFMKSAAAKLTSASAEAVELARANGIAVIPGACPMQFLGDVPHTCMRGLLRLTGALQM